MTPEKELAEWSRRCRGCMSVSTLVSIGDDIRTKYFESTSIMVSKDDGLPCFLCLDCLDTLNYSNQFRKECIRINMCLRKKLVEMKAKHKTLGKASRLNKNNNSLTQEQSIEKLIKKENGEKKADDEDCYYVVIINEDGKGEKNLQAIKMETSEDAGFILPVVKQEQADSEQEEGQFMDEVLLPVPEEKQQEPATQEIVTQPSNSHEVDQEQLKFIQVLSGNAGAVEGDNQDSLLIACEMEDGLAYTEQEVVVGNPEEYEVVCNEEEEEEVETITVIQQADGSFLCDCEESFMDYNEYLTHLNTHNVYACPVCERGFENKEIVQGHMLLHSSDDPKLPCPFCLESIKRNMITNHIREMHKLSRPHCNVCNKVFANEHNLKRHMCIHSGEKNFECNLCGKRFNQKVSMQNHRLLHKNGMDGLICEGCLCSFLSEQDLMQHQEDGCEGPDEEESYPCTLCNKFFASAGALRSHTEYQHSSTQMELLCSECGEVLPSRKAMYAHAYSHKQAKTKNLRRFACSTCGKGCSSHAMLLMHERVHTNERPYKCARCTLAFKTKTHLTTHQLTHTQEKRFGCSVCMKFFALKGNLVVHLRTHTGERPYVCSICNQAFIDSKYLKKHKQRRHDMGNIPWNQYY